MFWGAISGIPIPETGFCLCWESEFPTLTLGRHPNAGMALPNSLKNIYKGTYQTQLLSEKIHQKHPSHYSKILVYFAAQSLYLMIRPIPQIIYVVYLSAFLG